MKAIIVAAGVGSRLGELTKELPKPLIDINGKSIIERQILLFKKFGITKIVIIRGPHREKFSFNNVEYVDDDDYENHDLLGSLMVAGNELNEDVIISYGDVIFDETILEQTLSFSGNAGLAIDYNWEKNYSEKSKEFLGKVSVVTIENDSISNIGYYENTVKNSDSILGEFIGIMKLSALSANQFVTKYNELKINHDGKFHDSPSINFGIITDMINELIHNKIQFLPIKISGVWCEIDTHQDLENAKKLFLD
jgi:phosphoenolpyruvate phosphomutase